MIRRLGWESTSLTSAVLYITDLLSAWKTTISRLEEQVQEYLSSSDK